MKKSSRFFYIIIYTIALVCVLVSPKKYMTATLDGLDLFVNNVFPSLFPFFILTRILSILGVGEVLSKVVAKPVSKLFGTSAVGGYIFIVSLLSGYPVGAKMVSEYVKSGEITFVESKRIIAFTSTSGPLFIIGTVGVEMMGDVKLGYVVLLSHIAGAFLNGLLYRGRDNSLVSIDSEVVSDSFFNDALTSSVRAILQVGASIIFLNVLIVALQDLKVIDFFSNVIFRFLGDAKQSEAIAIGSIEITKGLKIFSTLENKKDIIVPIATIISFGGVSVMVQSMSFLKSIGIKASYYLLTKTSQAILTYAVSSIMVLVLY